MPRNQITSAIDWDNTTGILSLTFSNGTTREFGLFNLPKDIQIDLALHGLNQKLIDRCAGAATKGGTDPVAWSIDQVSKGYDNLAAGEWLAKRGTGEGPSSGITVRALARLKGYTEADAMAKWTALPKDKRQQVASHPDVRAMVARIRLEDAEAAAAKANETATAEVAF